VLKETYAVRVNIKTNMATFYENGKSIRTWKVATARNDGKSATPTGTFRFQELTVCQPWISTRNNAKAGPCESINPTGKFALWFSSREYGLHGVDSSHIDSVTGSTAESRRQSSGCVRNHPDNIEWLVKKVAPLYGTTPKELAGFKSRSAAKSYSPTNKGLALIIGRWDASKDGASVTVAPAVPPSASPADTTPENGAGAPKEETEETVN
jgi:hypothetical protein